MQMSFSLWSGHNDAQWVFVTYGPFWTKIYALNFSLFKIKKSRYDWFSRLGKCSCDHNFYADRWKWLRKMSLRCPTDIIRLYFIWSNVIKAIKTLRFRINIVHFFLLFSLLLHVLCNLAEDGEKDRKKANKQTMNLHYAHIF